MSTKNKMGWPFQFVQSGAFSLEANTQFAQASDAFAYVRFNPTAYKGKTITILTTSSYNNTTYTAGTYRIVETGSSYKIERLATELETAVLNNVTSAILACMGMSVDVVFDEKICTIMDGYANKAYIYQNIPPGAGELKLVYGNNTGVTLENGATVVNLDSKYMSPGINKYEVTLTRPVIGTVKICTGTFLASHPFYYYVSEEGNYNIANPAAVAPDGSTSEFNIVGIPEGWTLKVLTLPSSYNEHLKKSHGFLYITSDGSKIPLTKINKINHDGVDYDILESSPLSEGSLYNCIMHFK